MINIDPPYIEMRKFVAAWVHIKHRLGNMSCTVPESFFRGVQLFLLLDNQTNKRTYLKSNAETNTTKIGSSSARKRNAILAFCWHGPRKFFQRGSIFFLLLVNQTNKRTFLKCNAETNTTKIGSSSARKRNAMLMAFRWHAFDGRTLNAGLVAL